MVSRRRKSLKLSDTVFIQQGDCLELMKKIPDNHIDMILCDLPYGTTSNKWDSIIPLDILWAPTVRNERKKMWSEFFNQLNKFN